MGNWIAVMLRGQNAEAKAEAETPRPRSAITTNTFRTEWINFGSTRNYL